MAKNNTQTLFFEILLKLGVLFFLLGIFDNTLTLVGEVHNAFWEPVLKVILIIIFLGIGIINLALRKENFRTF